MVSTPARGATALWPPDDTEESIVGVDRHQLDIISLRTGINEEARRVAAGGPAPWQAISQIIFLGCRRPDNTHYKVYPDVFVFPRPMSRNVGSYSLQHDRAPVLIVEVASESTYETDLDLVRGKGYSYARAGVREYLVLDPTGVFVPTLGQGWRLDGRVYVPWVRDTLGRWQSETIGVAFGVEAGLAAVYGADGRRQVREGEVGTALASQRAAGISEGHAQGRAEGYSDGRAEGFSDGRAEGELAGKRATVRRLVQRRFGVVTALERRIDSAGESELDALLDRLFVAAGPDDL